MNIYSLFIAFQFSIKKLSTLHSQLSTLNSISPCLPTPESFYEMFAMQVNRQKKKR